MPDTQNVPAVNGTKTKTQKAFDFTKWAMVFGAFFGSLYTGLNSASDKRVASVVEQVNTDLVPQLQDKLVQHSERLARMEAKLEFFEKLLTRIEERLNRRYMRLPKSAGGGSAKPSPLVNDIGPPEDDAEDDSGASKDDSGLKIVKIEVAAPPVHAATDAAFQLPKIKKE